jgi:hypothetical protein
MVINTCIVHVVSQLGLRMFLPRFSRADVMWGMRCDSDVMEVMCMLGIDDGGELVDVLDMGAKHGAMEV